MKLYQVYLTLSLLCGVLVSSEIRGQASPNQNYIMTNIIKKSGVTVESDVPALPIILQGQGKAQTIAYFDGLGRPMQTVVTQGSYTLKDIVSGNEYDAFGREVKKYLPFADINNTATPGSYKSGWQTTQAGFYNGQLQGVESDAFPYSLSVIESSPLNRIQKSLAPGSSWVGSNQTRGIGMDYLSNTTADGVRIWNISSNALNYSNDDGTNLPQSLGIYDPNTLYKNVTRDENNNATVEYKDKYGQVILKKVQLDGTIAADYSGTAGFLSTYYVYDDLNQLRFVIPPKATAQLANYNWQFDPNNRADVINELCFRYEYDARNRMIAKKVPGAGWVYMVYDVRDRPVFTQDANMKGKNQWLTTLYDALNRPVSTGMITYSGTRDALQIYVNQNTGTGIPGSINARFPAIAKLIVGQRDPTKTTYIATKEIKFTGEFKSELTAYFTTVIGGTETTETVNVVDNPMPSGNNFIALTLTYYDDYNWNPSATYINSSVSKLDAGLNPNAETMSSTAATRGMVTGSKVRVIEDPADLTKGGWLATTSFYDDRGRIIQTQSDNYKNGTDVNTLLYDFSGKVLSSYLVHNNPAAANSKKGILTSVAYDAAGRVLSIKKNLYENDATTATTTNKIVTNDYNELGQLLKKTLAPDYSANGLEQQDYAYNIRGWLLGVNRGYTRDDDQSDYHHFGFDLGYDKSANNLIGGKQYTTPQYNGNIAGTVWKSKGDGEKRKYDFTYDAVNRLTAANFTQYTGGDFNTQAGFNFSVSNLSYDPNGNILSMSQKGWKAGVSDFIDQLSYTYLPNSNKLLNVKDGSNDAATTLGDFRTSLSHPQSSAKQTAVAAQDLALITDYSYDANGNLIKDFNKDIGNTSAGGIIYNHLNLPSQVTINGATGVKGTITYIYDAAGNKLEKKTYENASATNNNTSKSTTTDYIGAFVYENDQLQFLGSEEGRIRYKPAVNTSPASFVFDYFLKDHLGNIRSVLTDEQQIDRYPVATLEGSGTGSPESKEEGYYDINSSYVFDKPANISPDYLNDNGTNNPNTYADKSATSQKMYKLNANTNRTGLGKILKVMAGDKVSILAKSFYQYSGAPVGNIPLTPADLVSAFVTVVGGGNPAVQHGATGSLLNADPNLASSLNYFSTHNPVSATNNVKAGIAYIILDDHFKYVNTGYDAVYPGSSDGVKPHFIQDIAIPKNGYIYIYCYNESKTDVFFDNMEVVHTRGPILEETHYYPFGLQIAGISSKALAFGGSENREKFNGGNELQSKEFSDGSGLELYDANFRMYDPQIGRYHQNDPLADINEGWSPYTFVNDNPISFSDPLGLSVPGTPTAGDPNNPVEVVVTACPKCKAPVGSNINVAGAVGPPPASVGNPVTGAGASSTNISIAGAWPLIETPSLYPIRGGQFPRPGSKPAPWLRPGILGTIGLTIAATVYPLPTAGGAAYPMFAYDPFPGHGNNRDNWNPHIVYEFKFTPTDSKTPVLKYGISDIYRNDLERPQSQLARLQALYGASVTWDIYTRTLTREKALFIERTLVTQHVNRWGYMPRDQFRPDPFDDKTWKSFLR